MRKVYLVLLACIMFSLTVFAHPGRTDAKGGHTDRSDGGYHYHHGYSAHYHPNGKCPYDFDDATATARSSSARTFSIDWGGVIGLVIMASIVLSIIFHDNPVAMFVLWLFYVFPFIVLSSPYYILRFLYTCLKKGIDAAKRAKANRVQNRIARQEEREKKRADRRERKRRKRGKNTDELIKMTATAILDFSKEISKIPSDAAVINRLRELTALADYSRLHEMSEGWRKANDHIELLLNSLKERNSADAALHVKNASCSFLIFMTYYDSKAFRFKNEIINKRMRDFFDLILPMYK